MSVSEFIVNEIRKLSENRDLEILLNNTYWAAGMRARVVLEVDIEKDGPVTHGFEFRVRKPSEGMKP